MKGFDSRVKSSAMGPALGFTFNAMRNTRKQLASSGKPIPFGERPADRPFAEHLGSGRDYSRAATERNPGSVAAYTSQPTYGLAKPSDPTHFRKRAGLKTFSWESADA